MRSRFPRCQNRAHRYRQAGRGWQFPASRPRCRPPHRRHGWRLSWVLLRFHPVPQSPRACWQGLPPEQRAVRHHPVQSGCPQCRRTLRYGWRCRCPHGAVRSAQWHRPPQRRPSPGRRSARRRAHPESRGTWRRRCSLHGRGAEGLRSWRNRRCGCWYFRSSGQWRCRWCGRSPRRTAAARHLPPPGGWTGRRPGHGACPCRRQEMPRPPAGLRPCRPTPRRWRGHGSRQKWSAKGRCRMYFSWLTPQCPAGDAGPPPGWSRRASSPDPAP